MLKKIISYLFYGIGWGCSIFVFSTCIGSVAAGESFLSMLMQNYLLQAAASVFAGICCASSTIVYTIERLSRFKQISIHFIIGLSGYFVSAYFANWIPTQNWGHTVLFGFFAVTVFVAVWAAFYFYNLFQAKQINKKLKQVQSKP